ncbi:EEIG1/EHBP1 N-terminal domain protein [Quillaja saponaria]|uniref:EEIG1/EHBP1 N-terminal domain protein n=1 Tax=Quillaja saponaria TaxID=32244 RepID=A0AAD7LXP9_QUISA|nr:EEIG1/EHBP1 N-terminal domain protein [Quillaja saponaria]
MKMKYLKPWMQGQNTNNKHFEVKLKQLKLELGLRVRSYYNMVQGNCDDQNQMAIRIASIGKRRRQHRYTTEVRFWRRGKAIEWDVHNLCEFHVVSKDESFCPCELEFHILQSQRENAESKAKLVVVGEVSLNLEDLVRREMDSKSVIERKLPLSLKVNGLSMDTNLLVHLSFAELSNSHDSSGSVENSAESNRNRGLAKKMKYLTSFRKKNRGKHGQEGQVHSSDSDESPVFHSDESNETSSTSSGSNAELTKSTELESFPSSAAELDKVQKSNWSTMSWNRSSRRFSLTTTGRNKEKLTSSSEPLKAKHIVLNFLHNRRFKMTIVNGRKKEFKSRDGQAKLKTNVFFASFDQRSEKASGESACTALVALIAHWLHTNQDMPTRTEFDSILTDGSSEWRKLCNNEAYINLFPDKHFDLETVMEANLRPLVVLPEESYTGFFSPGKFEFLKGAMSFDEIWNEINSKNLDFQPRIYIVSWNDHFFVLKVEADAYYIIDSLGERLFEGCNQAYLLKFDASSLMYARVDKAEDSSEEKIGSKCSKNEEEISEVICRGKECCKEFIKRFLAAIPVSELEEEEKIGTVTSLRLHRQLQIEFHYSSSSSWPANSSTYLASKVKGVCQSRGGIKSYTR